MDDTIVTSESELIGVSTHAGCSWLLLSKEMLLPLRAAATLLIAFANFMKRKKQQEFLVAPL